MAIKPQYGEFIVLGAPNILEFVQKDILNQDFLDLGAAEKIRKLASHGANAEKMLLLPLHDDNNPYYLGHHHDDDHHHGAEEERRRVRIWVSQLDPSDPKRMVIIEELERNKDGNTVIVPNQMFVGGKLPIMGLMKSTCCKSASMSAVVAMKDGAGNMGYKIVDPEAGVISTRPKLLPEGVHVIASDQIDMFHDLAIHVYAHKTGQTVPEHDCHDAHEMTEIPRSGPAPKGM